MNCDDLLIHTAEFMAAYDTNADGSIDLGDSNNNDMIATMTV
jgi:hypothetical protein